MKLLTIGKPGMLERYTADNELYRTVEKVLVPAEAADDEILEAGRDADMLLVDAMSVVSEYVIENMPNLKIIHSQGVGYNYIDIEAARKRHIYVCNCKGMNAMPVAEQTILLALGLIREVSIGDVCVRRGEQIQNKGKHMSAGDLAELGDFTIGLVGFGDIARCVARLMNTFGAKVVYYCRHQATKEIEQEYRVTYKPLDELLGMSDMVSLHLPVTDETRNSVNREFFAKMKDGAYIINTARGDLVDSEALVEAIESGKIAGAGLDSIAGEPVQGDNILINQPQHVSDRLLFSCHIGGITRSAFKRGYAMVWEDFARAMSGEVPEHIVNPW